MEEECLDLDLDGNVEFELEVETDYRDFLDINTSESSNAVDKKVPKKTTITNNNSETSQPQMMGNKMMQNNDSLVFKTNNETQQSRTDLSSGVQMSMTSHTGNRNVQQEPTTSQSNGVLCINVADGSISIKNQSDPITPCNDIDKSRLQKSTIPPMKPCTKAAKGPTVIKIMSKEKIIEMLRNNQLKPVDNDNPLYKEVLQTMSRIPSTVNKVSAITTPSSTSSKPIVTYTNKKLSNTQNKFQDTRAQQKTEPRPIAQPQGMRVKQPSNPKVAQTKPFKPLDTFITTQKPKQLDSETEEIKRQITRYRRKMHTTRRKSLRLQQKLAQMRSLLTHPTFLSCLYKMSPSMKLLTEIQFNQSHLRTRGHRFTEKEKKMALSLYQKNSGGYKFLKELGFILPGPATLRKCKKKISTDNTSNYNLVEKLKLKVRHMSPSHRLCSLLFDEKLLTATNTKRTVIEQRDGAIELHADHALVFVVKGIFKYYQVPVSYMYSVGPTTGTLLAEHLRRIITDLQSIGFKVLATVCDQAENNRRAIELLINDARCDFVLTGDEYNDNVFVVNNERIVAMYDPPHLLKGVRNHLITKDLSFVLNGTNKTAKWIHLQMMFKENPRYKDKGLVSKLTEDHVFPDEEAIADTKLATQTFSQSVSSYMRYMAEKGILPPESQDTADLLLFFDQLYDSFNGYMANTHKNGKPLLNACKIDSAHHQTWENSIEILKTMTFVENGAPIEIPEIECWIWTIRSMKLLMKKLLQEYKLPLVWPRHLNQDAVERVFRVEVNPKIKPKNEEEKEPATIEDFTIKVIKGISRVNKHTDKISPDEYLPDIDVT